MDTTAMQFDQDVPRTKVLIGGVSIEGVSIEKQENEDQKENMQECCVCLESMELPFQAQCGHAFCYLCIKGIALTTVDNKDNDDDSDEDDNITKINCPLCRREIEISAIQHSTISSLKIQEKLLQCSCAWAYSGRDGWWLYDNKTNSLLELHFARYISQFSSTSEDKGDQRQKENNLTTELSADSNAINPFARIKIQISNNFYIIDFAKRTQENMDNSSKRRQIIRINPNIKPEINSNINIDQNSANNHNTISDSSFNTIMADKMENAKDIKIKGLAGISVAKQ